MTDEELRALEDSWNIAPKTDFEYKAKSDVYELLREVRRLKYSF